MTFMKPCPFCGSDEISANSRSNGMHYLTCDDCGTEGPYGWNCYDAHSAWHRRAEDASTTENEEYSK